jgi:hypothetical protein
MKKIYLLMMYILIALPFALSACSLEDEDDVKKDWTEKKVVEVGPEIVPVYAWFDSDYSVDGMRVKNLASSGWGSYTLDFIQGFHFEPGYSYELKVEVTHLGNPPADASDITCRLISVVAKYPAIYYDECSTATHP